MKTWFKGGNSDEKKMTWDFAKLAKRPFALPRDSTPLCAGNPI